MFYIQAGVNQSVDHFVFDVTNGITWLRGLMLKIIIIPENLYMQTRNVSVEEGELRRFFAIFLETNILIFPKKNKMIPNKIIENHKKNIFSLKGKH